MHVCPYGGGKMIASLLNVEVSSVQNVGDNNIHVTYILRQLFSLTG